MKNTNRLFWIAIVSALILFVGITKHYGAVDKPPQLTVAVRPFIPFVITDTDPMSGFCVELWQQIAADMNRTYQFKTVNSVDDIFTLIQNGQADLGFGGIAINAERETALDFSYPTFESGLQMLILDTGMSGSVGSRILKSIYELFKSRMIFKPIGFLILMLFISANAVWFFERKKNPAMFPGDNYFKGIWESIWWAAVTITTVGYGDKTPKSSVGRFIALIWMFSGVFLISFFAASVSSSLTVKQMQESISSPYDLVGKQVCTLRQSAGSIYMSKLGARVFELDSMDKCFEVVKRGLVTAMVYDAPSLRHYMNEKEKRGEIKVNGTGQLRIVGSVFNKLQYGFAFPINSPLRKTVNSALLKLYETGRHQEIQTRWFGAENH